MLVFLRTMIRLLADTLAWRIPPSPRLGPPREIRFEVVADQWPLSHDGTVLRR